MDLRDTIAIEVMRVLIEKAYNKPLTLAQSDTLPGLISRDAYAHADEMLSVRGVDLRSMEDTVTKRGDWYKREYGKLLDEVKMLTAERGEALSALAKWKGKE